MLIFPLCENQNQLYLFFSAFPSFLFCNFIWAYSSVFQSIFHVFSGSFKTWFQDCFDAPLFER